MMIKVRFQEQEYFLTDGSLKASAIATAEAYEHGLCSYAYLCADGRILRFNKEIGVREDLEVLEEVPDLEPADDFLGNLFGDSSWEIDGD